MLSSSAQNCQEEIARHPAQVLKVTSAESIHMYTNTHTHMHEHTTRVAEHSNNNKAVRIPWVLSTPNPILTQ